MITEDKSMSKLDEEFLRTKKGKDRAQTA